MSSVERQGYSASVEIRLTVNGDCLEVSQVGEELLILQRARELPPSNARLEIIIDGEEKGYPILLPVGASKDSRIVRFVDCFGSGSTDSIYNQLTQLPQAKDCGGVVVSASSCPRDSSQHFFE